MKKVLLNSVLVVLLLISVAGKAQYYDTTYAQKKKHPVENRDNNDDSLWKKLFYGGGLGLSFGNPNYIDIAPIVGYRITEKVSAGVGITYQYYDYNYGSYNFSTDVYGGSVFGRYYFRKNLFAHGEVEYLNLADFNYVDKRIGVESVLVGGGFIQRFSRNAGIVAMVLYNLTQSEYSPYASPVIIRVGVNIGI